MLLILINMPTPSQPTELDKAIEYYEESLKDSLYDGRNPKLSLILLAAKRAQEVEKERDKLKRVESVLCCAASTAAAERDQLRTEYKKALEALKDMLPSLVCAFTASQHVPQCDSFANPKSMWCAVCKRRNNINDILTTPLAIETMKEKKV